MIDKIIPKGKCFGCESCFVVCPKQAISFVENENGFDYPRVNYEKCINCGLCKKACPSFNAYSPIPKLPKVYSLRVKDDDTLLNSTSGGFFTLISDYIIDIGGYVCGAVFDENFNVKHLIASTKSTRNKMRGAKYAKSSIAECYTQIKELLDDGKILLFSGTPCQNHALKLFLGKPYDNLITIDIVCHGVPSKKYFSDYLDYIKNKYGAIKTIRFRSKRKGWHGNNLEIILEDERILFDTKDLKKYTSLYGSGFLMRENCFSCPYTSVFRVGDFSIGDCWGIEKTNTLFNDNKGCSLVFVNNQKASDIFEKIKSSLFVETRTVPEILQPNLLYPTKKPKNYDELYTKLAKKEFWKQFR